MARIHFIGICGTAMGTLAAMLKARGHHVQGSDAAVYPPMSEFLLREGIPALDGYRPEHITTELDLVVVGNSISRGNPELEEVLDRKIRFVSMPEMIREEFLWKSRSIVVAGTHGKTTTTALTAWLLTACGRDPSALIGGIALNLAGSYRLGGGRDFVIEGDEYDSAFFDKTAKFLKYLPDIAVVANLEYDHADIYPDLEALRVAFRRFVNQVPRSGRLILGADSEEAMNLASGARCIVDTFGLSADADWRASAVTPEGDRINFDLTHRGEPQGRVALPLFGGHNVRNALAAIASGHAAGLNVVEMIEALKDFRGVRRRMELRGKTGGVLVFDDFAHHPTAILETLRAVRWSYPDRRIWAIFEPRSATSCRKVFQQDFARSFEESGADEIILASVFRSTLPEAERLSVDEIIRHLNAAGKHARHIATVPEIVNIVAAESGPGDLVVVMSNGGFDGIHDKLLDALGARSTVQ
jgi:UDP-N-acetylmuramate: L-alanyl-gamma-D-glutamyl-meso-diaminopimelate ligase